MRKKHLLKFLSSSSLKCFSIIVAPRTTATLAANSLVVWSEKPTGHLYFFLNNLLHLNLIHLGKLDKK